MRTEFGRDFYVGDEEGIRKFATAIGDQNPLHHDETEAKKVGLRGIIAPGVMLTGFVSSTIAAEIPGVMVAELNMKFRKPLYAGSLLTVFCTVLQQRARLAKMGVTVRNGIDVMAHGSCMLVLPQ